MKTKLTFTKSPMNYPGGKFKLLPQLVPLFPPQINNFIDLFCGGLDVSCNVSANYKYANDIDNYLIDIYKAFQNVTYDELINFINIRIKEFNLTKYNYDGFIKYRTLYNKSKEYHTPLDLFVLSRFSYNNLIEIKNDKYNGAFGFNHSDFNLTQKAHTKFLHSKIQNINFSSYNFLDFNIDLFNSNDFLYVDPPYLKSENVYKNIKKWNENNEYELYNFLDEANKKGIKWGLSNLIFHKGEINEILEKWSYNYNIHDIYSNYSNSFYSNKTRNKNELSIEIFVTNY